MHPTLNLPPSWLRRKKKAKTLPATPYAIALDAAYHTRTSAIENLQQKLKIDAVEMERIALACKEYWATFIPNAVRKAVQDGKKGVIILCFGTPVHHSVLTDLRELGYDASFHPPLYADDVSNELVISWDEYISRNEMAIYKAENPVD